MNKHQLIRAVALRKKISQRVVKEVLDGFADTIKDEVCKGTSVVFVGFGTFLPKEMKGRKFRNPHSGETLFFPARVLPRFRAAPAFEKIVSDIHSIKAAVTDE